MRMRRESLVAIVTALAVAGVSAPADAVVLCVKKSGALFLRDACKRKETQVDPASFGATGPTGAPGGTGGTGQVTKIDFRAAANTPSTTILDSGKLQVTASCDGTGTLSVTATTAVDNATLHSYGNLIDFTSNDFDAATPIDITPFNNGDEERTFVYSEPGGQIVVIVYQAASQDAPLGGTVACLVSGVAFVQ